MAMLPAFLPARGLPLEELRAIRDPIETLLFDHTLRLLARGTDVVLDFGVWSRSEREDFRSRAAAVGARTEFISWTYQKTSFSSVSPAATRTSRPARSGSTKRGCAIGPRCSSARQPTN